MRFFFLWAFLEIRGDTVEGVPLDVLNKSEFCFKDFTFGNFGLGQIAVMKPMVSHDLVSNGGLYEAGPEIRIIFQFRLLSDFWIFFDDLSFMDFDVGFFFPLFLGLRS